MLTKSPDIGPWDFSRDSLSEAQIKEDINKTGENALQIRQMDV